MGVFDVNELKGAKNSRNEVTAYCTQAVREFFSTAKQIETPSFSRNIKYAHTSLGDRNNVTRQVKDGLFSSMHVVDFYLILVQSRFDSDFLNEEYGAAIALKNGYLYFDGHRSDAEEIGANVADVCGYIKEVAESLFKSALQGDPWDVAYAIVEGHGNIVGGRDVTKY